MFKMKGYRSSSLTLSLTTAFIRRIRTGDYARPTSAQHHRERSSARGVQTSVSAAPLEINSIVSQPQQFRLTNLGVLLLTYCKTSLCT